MRLTTELVKDLFVHARTDRPVAKMYGYITDEEAELEFYNWLIRVRARDDGSIPREEIEKGILNA